jgi:hypothetical protein
MNNDVDSTNLVCAALYHAAGAGVEIPVVMSVNADVEDSRVVVEHLLCPVPVVDCPVHYQDSLDS